MPIRNAQSADIPRIVELASRSLEDGPYAGVIADSPKHAQRCAEEVMQKGQILLAEEDGQVVGLLGFLLADHHFSGERYGAELMWYVEPEHRTMKAFGEGSAINLLKEAEQRAKA